MFSNMKHTKTEYSVLDLVLIRRLLKIDLLELANGVIKILNTEHASLIVGIVPEYVRGLLNVLVKLENAIIAEKSFIPQNELVSFAQKNASMLLSLVKVIEKSLLTLYLRKRRLSLHLCLPLDDELMSIGL